MVEEKTKDYYRKKINSFRKGNLFNFNRLCVLAEVEQSNLLNFLRGQDFRISITKLEKFIEVSKKEVRKYVDKL